MVTVPAGAQVAVGLPPEHPQIPVGAVVCWASSQAARRHYQFTRPKPGLHRNLCPLHVRVTVGRDTVSARAEFALAGQGDRKLNAEARVTSGAFSVADAPERTRDALRTAFAKMGGTRFTLGTLEEENPERLFVPISLLNQCRRDLVAAAEQAWQAALAARTAVVVAETAGGLGADAEDGRLRTAGDRLAEVRLPLPPEGRDSDWKTGASRPDDSSRGAAARPPVPCWSVKVDRAGYLQALSDADFPAVDEIVLDIGRESEAALRAELDELARRAGREKLRLALPVVLRTPEGDAVRRTVGRLRAEGWRKWEVSNLAGFALLAGGGLDLTTDWSLYCTNRLAVSQLFDMGVGRVTLSPEDGRENLAALLREFGGRAAVVVYQDTPLLISETCAFRGAEPACRGGGECGSPETIFAGKHGATFLAVRDQCRTVLLHDEPFSLAQHVRELTGAGAERLRVDFVWRHYTAERVRQIWGAFRAGTAPAGRDANFARGLQ